MAGREGAGRRPKGLCGGWPDAAYGSMSVLCAATPTVSATPDICSISTKRVAPPFVRATTASTSGGARGAVTRGSRGSGVQGGRVRRALMMMAGEPCDL